MAQSQAETQKSDFLRWYAKQDLYSPSARDTTHVLRKTLAFLTFLLVTAVTLALAVPAIQRVRLSSSPISRSLWIGRGRVDDLLLTAEKLNFLKACLSRQAFVGEVPTVSPFNSVSEIRFQEKGAHRCGRQPLGRTIKEDDKLFADLVKAAGSPDLSQPGIIATRDLLETLGYKTDNPKRLTIQFNNQDNPKLEVPIWFVVDFKLPMNLSYILTESSLAKLHQAGHLRMASRVRSGPANKLFPAPGVIRSNAELKDHLGPVETDFKDVKDSYVIFESTTGPLSEVRWRELLREFAGVLEYYKMRQPKGFADGMTMVDPISVGQKVRNGYVYAEVRVNSLDDLKSAAKGCRDADYPADETLVQQLDDVNANAKLLFWSILFTSVAIAINTVYVVIVIQRLRCEQKTPEFGMLKAMGMSDREFRTVFRHQSRELWKSSCFWGLLWSAVLAAGIGTLSLSSEEFCTGAAYFLFVAVCLWVLSYGLIRLAILRATEKARQMDAMAAIGMR